MTVLTLCCAAPVVLGATLLWIGSASSATPIVALLAALVLISAALARGRHAPTAQAPRVRTRDERVEVGRGELVLAACPLMEQTIAVQHFAAQGVAALSLLAQSGERVVFWADYDGAHSLFDPSVPVDACVGELDVARFDKHVELRARSLAQLCKDCIERQRATAPIEPPPRVDVTTGSVPHSDDPPLEREGLDSAARATFGPSRSR